MLIARIKDHNVVNGFWFSALEFFFLALVLFPFALFYLTHSRLGMGIAATGILSNALVVAGLAVRSIIRQEKDIGIRQMFTPDGRRAIRSQYPSLDVDTVLITFAILVPFLILLDALYEKVLPWS